MKKSLIFIFISLITTTAFSVEEKQLQSLPIKSVFEISVENPGPMTICRQSLWVFSESAQNLLKIDTNTGKVLKTFPLSDHGKNPADVAALTCKKENLYLLLNSAPTGRILEIADPADDLVIAKEFTLPEKTRATDLFCNQDQCWLLQKASYQSKDLKNWKPISIPKPPELKKVNSHKHLDPFEDWQAKLNLAEGSYIKGDINTKNQVALLDPFHSQVIVNKNFTDSKSSWLKWGKFGAWEGSFLSPKAFLFINDQTLAIADSKLKAIFLFDIDGTYLGILTLDSKKIFSPDYPMEIAFQNNRLFVSDFRSNKVLAVDILKLTSDAKGSEELSIRQNLFRREEVLKDQPSSLCLNCHDGTITNQLYKFIKLKHHHPLECSQCHDPHHVIKKPHFLRETSQQLCQSCHKDYVNPKTNHSWDGPKKGGQCKDCHASHSNTGKILIKAQPQLCESCHQNKMFTHKSTEDISILEKAKGVHLEQGKFNCQTCHQTHINWRETHFVKEPKEVLNFCSSCHGEKSLRLYKEFHKSIKLKKDHK